MTQIDTRDLLTELDTLLDRRDDEDQTDPLSGDEIERVDVLVSLRNEIGDEFDYGTQMIPVEDFVEYAQELAEECGLINPKASWPNSCIDWVHAANELAYDYTIIMLDDINYYVRCN